MEAAQEWADIALARGDFSVLKQSDVAAALTLSSKSSVVRSQLVATHALTRGQSSRCKTRLETEASRDRIVLIPVNFDFLNKTLN